MVFSGQGLDSVVEGREQARWPAGQLAHVFDGTGLERV